MSTEVLHNRRYPLVKEKVTKREVSPDYLVCTHPESQSCGSAQLSQLDA